MRRGITRTLIVAAAASAVASALALAAAAGAGAARASAPHFNLPSGPPVYTAPCPIQTPVLTAVLTPAPSLSGCSGYQASGRDFRFAQAVITVPATPCTSGSPMRYIALAGAADTYARAGIECGLVGAPARGPGASVAADGAGLYHGFFEVVSQGATTFSQHLDTVSPGDGVFFSIYFNQAGNADRFTASGPGVSTANSVGAGGPVYHRAYALADWSLSSVPGVIQNTRVSQFLQGRFTTASGHRGTFEGPWTLGQVEVTSNGFAPPGGRLISAPSDLWSDGNSLGGLPGDAFSVWLYS
jgi:hypothetical protein